MPKNDSQYEISLRRDPRTRRPQLRITPPPRKLSRLFFCLSMLSFAAGIVWAVIVFYRQPDTYGTDFDPAQFLSRYWLPLIVFGCGFIFFRLQPDVLPWERRLDAALDGGGE